MPAAWALLRWNLSFNRCFDLRTAPMGKTTIVFGILLILLGVGVYAGLAATEASAPSKTALIPAFFGLPILLLGIVALKDAYRKHAMHVVAVFALLGLIAPVGRLASKLGSLGEMAPLALASMILMALLSGGLFVVCFKSFLDARRRRKEEEAGQAS